MKAKNTAHKDLQQIQDDVLAMGGMVGKAISRAIEALKKRDLEKT